LARRDASPREVGLAGEFLVLSRLRRAGFRLLARRIETRFGELDLVLSRRDLLFVVEVKTGVRRGEFRPRDHFDPKTRKRQARAAEEIRGTLGLEGCVLVLAEVVRTAGACPLLAFSILHAAGTRVGPRTIISWLES